MNTGNRYVLLGLARPRAQWFKSVSHWTTSAAVPAEFLKCVSVEELKARMVGGRIFSAVLLDGTLPVVDRDLLQSARDAGCVVLIIDDGRRSREWIELGATAILSPDLGRAELLDALVTHAEMVGATTPVFAASSDQDIDLTKALVPSSVVGVCGPGGTGASILAGSLAQGLGQGSAQQGKIALVDLALHSEQAMLHDVRDVVPGIQELVDAHRIGTPSDREVRALTFEVAERNYQLLLGLRQARYWPSIRPHAFAAAFESLRRTFEVIVCDISSDFEGANSTGSADLEERNLMARHVSRNADVVFVVGHPGVKGLHSLMRVITELIANDVEPTRIVPVINQAPRQQRQRAQISRGIAELTASVIGKAQIAPPLFIPHRNIEQAIRDVVRLPAPLPSTMAGAYNAVLNKVGHQGITPTLDLQLVAPGSLGTWSDDDLEAV